MKRLTASEALEHKWIRKHKGGVVHLVSHRWPFISSVSIHLSVGPLVHSFCFIWSIGPFIGGFIGPLVHSFVFFALDVKRGLHCVPVHECPTRFQTLVVVFERIQTDE